MIRQISKRYSISVHTRTKMSLLTTPKFISDPRSQLHQISRQRCAKTLFLIKSNKMKSQGVICPETLEVISTTLYHHEHFDVSNVVEVVHSAIFLRHYGNEEAQTTEGPKCRLWFGGFNVDKFLHSGKADISKLGISSSIHFEFYHSEYLEKYKENGTFFLGHGGTKFFSHHYLEIW
ncbi:uncharacterized protein TNCV_1991671 [Trichonephila clavipes]|nr:uncharacterized protein TNCV_1991671 [Trichonephila clavipes]